MSSSETRKSFILRIGSIQRLFRNEFERQASELGITMSQYLVLSRLWKKDNLLTSTLAREIAVTNATMTGILDRLESKDLICRALSKEDRRAINIQLTEKGRQIRKPLRKIIRSIDKMALQGFSSEEQEQFIERLEQVRDNFEY